MKYIDAEKLIAKLTKMQFDLNASYRHPQSDNIVRAISLEYDDILSLINSLQQEQPDNEDIDKVAQELYEHLYELKRSNNVPTNLYDKQEIINLWKAGIEYGRNHPKQGQPCKDLDVEMDKFFETMPVLEHENIFEDTFKNIARHFAQWQKEQDKRLIKLAHDSWFKEGIIYGKFEGLSEDEKYQQGRFDMKEQMLKGAIDGFVSERDITENHRLWVYPYSDSLDLSKKGFKYNDDVKIIIVKDDQL